MKHDIDLVNPTTREMVEAIIDNEVITVKFTREITIDYPLNEQVVVYEVSRDTVLDKCVKDINSRGLANQGEKVYDNTEKDK